MALVVIAIAVVSWLSWRTEPSACPRPPHSPRHEIDSKHTDGDESATGPRIVGTTEPGARVRAFSHYLDRFDPDKPVATVRAAKNGRFVLPLKMASFPPAFVVSADLAGFVGAWDRAMIGTSVDLPLQRGKIATHWVVDRDGQPIAGASVAAVVAPRRNRIDRDTAITDADGSVRLRMSHDDRLRVTADGYEDLFRFSPSLTSRRDLATYMLGPEPVIRVRCVDKQGHPVSHARVLLDAPPDGSSPWGGEEALVGLSHYNADTQGRVVLRGVLGVHHAVQARTPYLDSSRVHLESRWVTLGQGDVTLVLMRTATVRGRVTPVLEGVRVWLAGGSSATSGADGRFTLFGVVPGRRKLTALRKRTGQAGALTMDVQAGATHDVVIRLAATGSFLRLRAIRPDGSSAPDPDWTTWPPHDGIDTEHGTAVLHYPVEPGTAIDVYRPARGQLRTTASGREVHTLQILPLRRFTVQGVEHAWFKHAEDLGDKSWTHRQEPGTPMEWRARSRGRTGRGTIPAPRDGEVVKLPLLRTATLRGRLVNEAGEPIRSEIGSTFMVIDFMDDATDRFVRHGIMSGRVVLAAYEPGSSAVGFPICLLRRTLQLAEGEVRDLGDLVVPRFAAVRGRVRDANGRPVGGTLVYLLDGERELIGRVRSTSDGVFATQVRKAAKIGALAEQADGRMALSTHEPFHLTLGPAGTLALPESEEPLTLATADGLVVRPVCPGTELRLPVGDYIVIGPHGRRTVNVKPDSDGAKTR